LENDENGKIASHSARRDLGSTPGGKKTNKETHGGVNDRD